MGNGWYGDPIGKTISVELVHGTPWDHLRETTIIGGPLGETALLSQVYPASPLDPLLVIREPDGTIRTPLLPLGPEEEAIAGCVAEAAQDDDFDAVLDCLGLLDPGDGSEGVFLPPGWAGLGAPECEDGGLVVDGPAGSVSGDTVLQVVEHAIESLDGWIYGPVDADYRAAVENLVAVAEAWADAYQAIAQDPFSVQARTDLLQASVQFQDALEHFSAEASRLYGQNFGISNIYAPIPGEEPQQQDPRCQQQEVDSARGTLFTNPDFCPSGDYGMCLAEEADPVRDITDGKCATVEGPAGGKVLRCNDADGEPLEVTIDEASNPSSTDPLEWTDLNSPPIYAGQVHYRYIDTLDLGHILVGLCAAGGCPDHPGAS